MKKIFATAILYACAALQNLSAQTPLGKMRGHTSVFFATTTGGVLSLSPPLYKIMNDKSWTGKIDRNISCRYHSTAGIMIGMTFNERRNPDDPFPLPVTLGYFREENNGPYDVFFSGGFVSITIPSEKRFYWGLVGRMGAYRIDERLVPKTIMSPYGLRYKVTPKSQAKSVEIFAGYAFRRNFSPNTAVKTAMDISCRFGITGNFCEAEASLSFHFSRNAGKIMSKHDCSQ